MITNMDGLPQHLAATSALCSGDLPFLVQLLLIMKRGDVTTVISPMFLHGSLLRNLAVPSATPR
jgi:hypothetical protein